MGVKHNASYQSGDKVTEKSSGRLADVLVRNLNGEFDEIGMELSLEFRKVESSEDGEITIRAIEIGDCKNDGLEDIKKRNRHIGSS